MKKKQIKFLVLTLLIVNLSINLSVFTSLFNSKPTWDKTDDYSTTLESKVPLLSWTEDGNAICTEVHNQENAQICSDGAGGAIITWQDLRSGTWDIYAQRINSTRDVQWINDGEPICTATGHQERPQICSDGAGGAIITWQDRRTGVYDIYTQRINSTGDVQWTSDGEPISTVIDFQIDPQICSDGIGGAIITWQDARGAASDIYAQRINSTGDVQWTSDGEPICTASSYRYYPQICSDGAEGAIITWFDERTGVYDIYTQRINSTGDVQWTNDGEPICTAIGIQTYPQICSDGAGGAIITWQDRRTGVYDIYAQWINSTGDVQWTSDGEPISTAINLQINCQICSDGAGGAIITWRDKRTGTNMDIYAQWVNSTGDVQWTSDGEPICTAILDQSIPQICSNGAGGAIITWQDYRSGTWDVYAQWVNSTGDGQWTSDGEAICTATGDQSIPQICSNGAGGAIITWQDYRTGTNWDIYVQSIGNVPISNHPDDIVATVGSTIFIGWILDDYFGGGQCRVLIDGIPGVWSAWTPNINLQYPIDTSSGGTYNYTIQYNDSNSQYGIPDTVIVIIDDIPTSNHPDDIGTTVGSTIFIEWILYDDIGGGQCRVLIDGVPGEWSAWTPNENLNFSVDTSVSGIYNYTIQYYDSNSQYGIPDTVIITITDNVPTSNHPDDIETAVDSTIAIGWILDDDIGGGQYRVLIDGIAGAWAAWAPNENLNFSVDTSVSGTYNYTIQYYDSNSQYGTPDTIIVTITKPSPSSQGIDGFSLIILSISSFAIVIVLLRKYQRSLKRAEHLK